MTKMRLIDAEGSELQTQDRRQLMRYKTESEG